MTAGAPIAVSVFSGAGGLDLGFRYAGFAIPVAVEIDADAAATYKLNCERAKWDTVVMEEDITFVKSEKLIDVALSGGAVEIDVLLGGPPCQSWSVAGGNDGG